VDYQDLVWRIRMKFTIEFSLRLSNNASNMWMNFLHHQIRRAQHLETKKWSRLIVRSRQSLSHYRPCLKLQTMRPASWEKQSWFPKRTCKFYLLLVQNHHKHKLKSDQPPPQLLAATQKIHKCKLKSHRSKLTKY